MLKLFFACLLILPAIAHADEWSDADTSRETAYLVFHVIDWGQTRNIARNPDKLQEQNTVLGKHPSVGKVDSYFALTGLAHIAIAYYLPAEYRKAWQYISIGFEGDVVAHNFSIGIGVKF